MTKISRARSIVVSVWHIAMQSVMAFTFPTWYGPAREYHPEKHYMRGPGPKWRAKHLVDRQRLT
jgi:hypothetical protein